MPNGHYAYCPLCLTYLCITFLCRTSRTPPIDTCDKVTYCIRTEVPTKASVTLLRWPIVVSGLTATNQLFWLKIGFTDEVSSAFGDIKHHPIHVCEHFAAIRNLKKPTLSYFLASKTCICFQFLDIGIVENMLKLCNMYEHWRLW